MKEKKHFFLKKIKKLLINNTWLQYVMLPLLLLAAGIKLICFDNTHRSKKSLAWIVCVFFILYNTATMCVQASGENDSENNSVQSEIYEEMVLDRPIDTDENLIIDNLQVEESVSDEKNEAENHEDNNEINDVGSLETDISETCYGELNKSVESSDDKIEEIEFEDEIENIEIIENEKYFGEATNLVYESENLEGVIDEISDESDLQEIESEDIELLKDGRDLEDSITPMAAVKILEITFPDHVITVGDDIPEITFEDIVFFPEIKNLKQEERLRTALSEVRYDCENANRAGNYETIEIDLEEIVIPSYDSVDIHPGVLTIQPKIIESSDFETLGTVSYFLEDVYVSPIVIEAVDEGGFDLVSTDGIEYGKQVVITEETLSGEVMLTFKKGEALSEPYLFNYKMDMTPPEITNISVEGNKINPLEQIVYGKENITYKVAISDNLTGARSLSYSYGEVNESVLIYEGNAEFIIEEAYSGSVSLQCVDYAGNNSQIMSFTQLMDTIEPSISYFYFDENEQEWSECLKNPEIINDVEKVTIRVVLSDDGENVSGIDCSRIICEVDGERIDFTPRYMERIELDDGRIVDKKVYFEFVLDKNGRNDVFVKTFDHSGNFSENIKMFGIFDNTNLKIWVPSSTILNIDPYNHAQRGQIYSKGITVMNMNDFDIYADVSQINLSVNHNTANGVGEKDANIMVGLVGGEKEYELKEGINNRVCSFVVPAGHDSAEASLVDEKQQEFLKQEIWSQEVIEMMDTDEDFNGVNSRTITFSGNLSKGSEREWKNGDIHMKVIFQFSKK